MVEVLVVSEQRRAHVVLQTLLQFAGYVVAGLLGGFLAYLLGRVLYIFLRVLKAYRRERRRLHDLLDHHEALRIARASQELSSNLSIEPFCVDPDESPEANTMRFAEHLDYHHPDLPKQLKFSLVFAFQDHWYAEVLSNQWKEDLEDIKPEDFRP